MDWRNSFLFPANQALLEEKLNKMIFENTNFPPSITSILSHLPSKLSLLWKLFVFFMVVPDTLPISNSPSPSQTLFFDRLRLIKIEFLKKHSGVSDSLLVNEVCTIAFVDELLFLAYVL